MSDHFDFFCDLRMMPHGQAQIVSGKQLADILPPSWRDERVSGPEEWFVRTGRGMGLEIHYVVERDYFVVTHDCRPRSLAVGQGSR